MVVFQAQHCVDEIGKVIDIISVPLATTVIEPDAAIKAMQNALAEAARRLRLLRQELGSTPQSTDAVATSPLATSGSTATPNRLPTTIKKRVTFSEEVLQEHENRAVAKVEHNRKKKRDAAHGAVAWTGRGLSPGAVSWLTASLRPDWSRQVAEAGRSAAEVLHHQAESESSAAGATGAVEDDDLAMDEATTCLRCDLDSQTGALLEKVVAVDVDAIVAASCAAGADGSLRIRIIAEFIADAFRLHFLHVSEGRIRSFCEEWLKVVGSGGVDTDANSANSRRKSAAAAALAARSTSSAGLEDSSEAAHTPPRRFYSLSRCLELLRFVAVTLAMTRQNHNLFFASLAPVEVAALLFAPLAIGGTLHTGLSNEELVTRHIHIALMFAGLPRSSFGCHPAEELSCFAATACLLTDPNCDFITTLLGKPSHCSNDAVSQKWGTFRAFHEAVRNFATKSTPRSHSDLLRSIRESTAAKSVHEAKEFAVGYLAGLLHLGVLGFHACQAPERFVAWTRAWASERHHHAELAAHVPRGALEPASSQDRSSAEAQLLVEAHAAVLRFGVASLINVLQAKYFGDVVAAVSNTSGTDGTISLDAPLILPAAWALHLEENTRLLEAMAPGECHRRFAASLAAGARRPVEASLRPNLLPICRLLLNTPTDPLAHFVATDLEAAVSFSADEPIGANDSRLPPPAVVGPLESPLVPMLLESQSRPLNATHLVAARLLERELVLITRAPPPPHRAAFERLVAPICRRWLECLISMQGAVASTESSNGGDGVQPLVKHPDEAGERRASDPRQLRLLVASDKAALDYCFFIAHLPPPHPRDAARFFVDPVIFTYTQSLIHVAEARMHPDAVEGGVPHSALSQDFAPHFATTAPVGAAGMSRILRRFEEFSHRVATDTNTHAAWAKAKQHLYRHQ